SYCASVSRPTVRIASSRSFGSSAVLLRRLLPIEQNRRKNFGVCASTRKILPTVPPLSAARLSKITRSASGRSSRLRYGTRAAMSAPPADKDVPDFDRAPGSGEQHLGYRAAGRNHGHHRLFLGDHDVDEDRTGG